MLCRENCKRGRALAPLQQPGIFRKQTTPRARTDEQGSAFITSLIRVDGTFAYRTSTGRFIGNLDFTYERSVSKCNIIPIRTYLRCQSILWEKDGAKWANVPDARRYQYETSGGIKNTPTPSNNHKYISTASKNKFNKFTSPEKRSGLPRVTRSAYGVPFDLQVIAMYIWTCAVI